VACAILKNSLACCNVLLWNLYFRSIHICHAVASVVSSNRTCTDASILSYCVIIVLTLRGSVTVSPPRRQSALTSLYLHPWTLASDLTIGSGLSRWLIMYLLVSYLPAIVTGVTLATPEVFSTPQLVTAEIKWSAGMGLTCV